MKKLILIVAAMVAAIVPCVAEPLMAGDTPVMAGDLEVAVNLVDGDLNEVKAGPDMLPVKVVDLGDDGLVVVTVDAEGAPVALAAGDIGVIAVVLEEGVAIMAGEAAVTAGECSIVGVAPEEEAEVAGRAVAYHVRAICPAEAATEDAG